MEKLQPRSVKKTDEEKHQKESERPRDILKIFRDAGKIASWKTFLEWYTVYRIQCAFWLLTSNLPGLCCPTGDNYQETWLGCMRIQPCTRPASAKELNVGLICSAILEPRHRMTPLS